jgi:hypothetical protein
VHLTLIGAEDLGTVDQPLHASARQRRRHRLITDRLITDRLITDRLITDRLITDRRSTAGAPASGRGHRLDGCLLSRA